MNKPKHPNSIFSDIFGETIFRIIFYGLAFIGVWFLSQNWSAWVFIIFGLIFMLGLPIYFYFRAKNKKTDPIRTPEKSRY